MAQVGSLYTSLTLESSSFISGLKKSAEAADRQSKIMERSFNAAKNAASGFFAAVSVGSIVAVGKQALDYAANLGEVAQSLGISTDALQQYSYMATQAGLSQQEMEKAIGRLTKTLGEAKSGSESAQRAFAAIGVSSKELAGLNTEEAMKRIADALKAIPDPSKRAAIEVAMFGRAGQKLDPLLSEGSAAVDELAMAANRLGVVLSAEQIQKADEAADKMAALMTVLQVNIASVVADNAGAIMKLANALASLGERAAAMSDENWANVWKATGAGAVGGTLAGGFPFGTAGGAAVGFGVGFYGQSGKAMARKSRMPDRGAGSPGWSYDAKTGKWVSTAAATPTAPIVDPEALFRKSSRERTGRPERDAFLESLKSMQLEEDLLANMRATADIEDPLLFKRMTQDADTLLSKVAALDEKGVSHLNELGAAADKRAEEFERMRDFADQAAASIASGFEDAIIEGRNFGSILKGLIEDIARLAIRQAVLKPLSNALATGIGSFFGGARAAGGPVGDGSAYLVGERGPEMFMPGRSGTIIPNGAMKGVGQAGRQVVEVVARVAPSPFFITSVAQATSAASQSAAGEAIRTRTRPKLMGGLG